MSQFQKVIKYLAFAFAMFLVVTIIQVSTLFIDTVAPLLGLEHSSNNEKVEEMISLNQNDVSYLDIDLTSANVEIRSGDRFSAQSNNDNIICKQENQKIKIKEKKHQFFGINNSAKVIITVPDDLVLDAIQINAGAGKVSIDKIQAKSGDVDLGAGDFTIKEIFISKELTVDSGAGKVTISSGSINNLDLEVGVGKAFICSSLLGNSKIEAGVGELELELLSVKDDYSFKVEKGMGSILYNGKNIDSSSFGKGHNFLDIEGGIGSIKIND